MTQRIVVLLVTILVVVPTSDIAVPVGMVIVVADIITRVSPSSLLAGRISCSVDDRNYVVKRVGERPFVSQGGLASKFDNYRRRSRSSSLIAEARR